jgi:predicted histidine transporter YuiF (NhaC family)
MVDLTTLGIIIFFLGLLFVRFIYPKIEYEEDDKCKKEKIELQYQHYKDKSLTNLGIAMAFIIAGLSITEKGTIAGALVIIGFILLFIVIFHRAESDRYYNSLIRRYSPPDNIRSRKKKIWIREVRLWVQKHLKQILDR